MGANENGSEDAEDKSNDLSNEERYLTLAIMRQYEWMKTCDSARIPIEVANAVNKMEAQPSNEQLRGIVLTTARDHIVCSSACSSHILRYVPPYEPYAVFHMIHMQSQHNYRFGLITHTNGIVVCILSLHINCYASACVVQTLHMVLHTKRMLHACILVGPHGGLHMKPYPVQLKCRYRITVFNNTFSLYIIGTKFVCTLLRPFSITTIMDCLPRFVLWLSK